MQLSIFQCSLLPSHPQELHFTFEQWVLSLQFCQCFFLVSDFDSVSSDCMCHHREMSALTFVHPAMIFVQPSSSSIDFLLS